MVIMFVFVLLSLGFNCCRVIVNQDGDGVKVCEFLVQAGRETRNTVKIIMLYSPDDGL